MGEGHAAADLSSALRALPSVTRLAAQLSSEEAAAGADDARRDGDPQLSPVVIAAARAAIERQREQLRAGDATSDGDLLADARAELARMRGGSLRRVINATGVIVHTNLGRAPLAEQAREAVARAAHGYSNLELELDGGGRGSRQDHVAALACELTGAAAALVVNNCAGALLLAAATLAGNGRSLIVSRGQLVEIGGSFRIPDVVAASGSRLVEVGATNRTRRSDYERALADERAQGREVGALLRVHPSNFRAVGFVAEVEIEALCDLGVAVIDDVGSGVLTHWPADDTTTGGLQALAQEPSVRRSVAAGAALVCFSGDKLLGGPQAGLLVGDGEAVQAAAARPLARALRIDKLSLAALAATLSLYGEPARARREIPVLAMLDAAPQLLAQRATTLARALGVAGIDARVVDAVARVGGGALPLLELPGPAVRVVTACGADAAAAALRRAGPPVLARISDGALLLDPRTVADDELDALASAVLGALAGL